MELTIYTSPTCQSCFKAKEYLKQRNVSYRERNVVEDRSALKEMIELTGRKSVPVIRCGDEVIVGFSPSRLDQMIECAQNQTPVE